jgi:hypothetical protein
MVDVNTKMPTPSERMEARIKKVADINRVPGVRVEPADDDMRRLLKHPTAGGFRAEGPIEWPNDTFTFRRLKEGSIKLIEEEKNKNGEGEEKPHEEKPHGRHANKSHTSEE